MNKANIKFTKLNNKAVIPSREHGNAGMDIYACFKENYLTIKPNHTLLIPTGIASACSPNYYFQLFERGSTGSRGMGLRCGVIDSNYRGEWFVAITNHTETTIAIVKSEYLDIFKASFLESKVNIYPYEKAIAQAVLLPVPNIQVEEIPLEEYSKYTTNRGTGCLGSSGK